MDVSGAISGGGPLLGLAGEVKKCEVGALPAGGMHSRGRGCACEG